MIGTHLGRQFGVDGVAARYLRAHRPATVDAGFAAGESAPGILRNPRIPFETQTVETPDGARLHVREYGPATAPRVLLIHGYSARIEYWNPQIALLADRYRVIAYDQRGCGRSTLGTRTYGTDALGDDLSAVLAAVVPAGQRITIVGHSLGGIATMAWAGRHPGEVIDYAHAVVLANTVAENFAAHTKVIPLLKYSRRVRNRLLEELLGRIPIPAPIPVADLFRRTVLSVAADAPSTAFVAALVRSCPNPFRTRSLQVLVGLDVTAGLSCLPVPVTVVSAELDRLTPPTATAVIIDLLDRGGNRCRAVEFRGYGHCVSIEAPHAFTDELERVLPLVGAGRAAG